MKLSFTPFCQGFHESLSALSIFSSVNLLRGRFFVRVTTHHLRTPIQKSRLRRDGDREKLR